MTLRPPRFSPAGRRFFLLLTGLLAAAPEIFALGQLPCVADAPSPGSFALARPGAVAAIVVDPNDWPGVIRAAGDLRTDVGRVTGRTPELFNADNRRGKCHHHRHDREKSAGGPADPGKEN
jgi:hypothetical protein